MSGTRYAKPGSDPNDAPERHLSSPLIAGINIPLNIVCRVARHRSEKERRSMIWLSNYSSMRQITADALAAELDMDCIAIRRALTDPSEDLTRFVQQVTKLRAEFEKTIPTYVDTEVARLAAKAVKFAAKSRACCELIGKTRMGKSLTGARAEYLRLLDRAIWLDCPSDNTERTFVMALARSMGMSTGTAKKAHQMTPAIISCLGTGFIELIIIDEGHFLWPSDAKLKPARLEFVRVDLNADRKRAGVLVIATPQHTESLNQSLSTAGRWAPGQWEGRVQRFHCPDAMSEEDLAAIARFHCPEACDQMVEDLVLQAMATEGYAGGMVNTIERARFDAGDRKLTTKDIAQAQGQMARGSRIEQLAKVVEMKPRRSARRAA